MTAQQREKKKERGIGEEDEMKEAKRERNKPQSRFSVIPSRARSFCEFESDADEPSDRNVLWEGGLCGGTRF